MKITNLKESPQLIEKAKKLIEKSFDYPESESFAVDFYPLYNKDNFQNCFVMEDEGLVLAHIGVRPRSLAGHPILMIGGIAVEEESRGQGIFKKLFRYVLESHQDVALYLLWSDQLSLYEKFNFYPAGSLYEYDKQQSEHQFSVQKSCWSTFDLYDLYNNKSETRLERSTRDWEEIKKISSSKLFLVKKESEIVNYFVKDKGADLNGIIHEYGWIDEDQLNVFCNFGKVWSPQKFQSSRALFGTVLRPGSKIHFQKMIDSLFDIKVLDFTNDQVSFLFEGKSLKLSLPDFLEGLFGPNKFKELEDSKSIFISGLDSI